MQLLLDFSDGSVSATADGKNCVASSCAHRGQVTFTTAYCNTIGQNVKGLCGKYGLITFILSSSGQIMDNLGKAFLE